MGKAFYVRREFLGGPEGGGNTAYIDAYIAGPPASYFSDAQFCLHDGNDNVHLHFELDNRRDYRRALEKAYALVLAAERFRDAIENWDVEAHLAWNKEEMRKTRERRKKA